MTTDLPTFGDFRANMQEIWTKQFSTRVPNTTKRSVGLDPQTGLLIGGRDESLNGILSRPVRDLPSAWSCYSAADMHVTFGDLLPGPTHVNISAEQQQQFAAVQDLPRNMALRSGVGSGTWGDLSLGRPQLLVSSDTLVASFPDFSEAVFVLRNLYIERARSALNARQLGTLRAGWGMQMTLARLTRPLSPDQQELTDQLLEYWEERIGPCVLTSLTAGLFVVENDRFSFDPELRADYWL